MSESESVEVDRSWLAYVDSITSLVAYRGLDDESRRDLIAISARARGLATGASAPGAARRADHHRAERVDGRDRVER